MQKSQFEDLTFFKLLLWRFHALTCHLLNPLKPIIVLFNRGVVDKSSPCTQGFRVRPPALPVQFRGILINKSRAMYSGVSSSIPSSTSLSDEILSYGPDFLRRLKQKHCRLSLRVLPDIKVSTNKQTQLSTGTANEQPQHFCHRRIEQTHIKRHRKRRMLMVSTVCSRHTLRLTLRSYFYDIVLR